VARLGILTGGGDCPGLNAVIRAVTRRALDRGWEVAGVREGWRGLVDGIVEPLGRREVSGILPRGGTIIGTSRTNPYTVEFGIDKLLATFEREGLAALVAIGGEDTLGVAAKLYAERGFPVVGVPKTIDNDLNATDYTFGFDTAVTIATEAIDRLHTTAESHNRVMVVEVMGRHTGWIAVYAGIAGGADVILIPEIPFDIGSICEAIKKRSGRGSRFSIIVAAEGAFPAGGDRVVAKAADERNAIERLGGIGQYVAKQIEQCLEMDVRVTVLGHLQRGGSPTTFDRALGSRYGTKAVAMVAAGEFGLMACLRGRSIGTISIEDATRDLNQVDPEGEIVQTAEDLGIMLGR
jgi:6-phosphofructokinase 1